MKLYVVFIFRLCDDPYYGYFEKLDNVYETEAEAYTRVQELLGTDKNGKPTYLSRAGKQAFVTLEETETGNFKNRTVLFNSFPEEEDN